MDKIIKTRGEGIYLAVSVAFTQSRSSAIAALVVSGSKSCQAGSNLSEGDLYICIPVYSYKPPSHHQHRLVHRWW